MTAKISVVVPVYNVEKYMDRAMRSLVNQTYNDIEILVIDDCTLDQSIEIVKKYQKEDGRIKIIHHDVNKGLGEARNTGVRESLGEYIYFMDSDDWVEENTLEIMYRTAIAENADIVECGSKIVFEDGSSQKFLSSKINTSNKLEAISLICEHKIGFMAWDKLYKASLIKQHAMEFYPILHEDINFAIQVVYYANKLVAIPDILYYYFQRNESISNTRITQKHLDSYVCIIDYANKFIADVGLFEESPESVYILQKCLVNWLLERLLRFYRSPSDMQDQTSQWITALNSRFGKHSIFVNCLLPLLLENIIHHQNMQDKNRFKRKVYKIFSLIKGK